MSPHLPILLIGAGALGGAILKGTLGIGHINVRDIMVCDLHPSDEVKALGVIINPPRDSVLRAKTIILAVKPQVWPSVADEFVANLNPEATLVSVMAGVRIDSLSTRFQQKNIVRVMPTTGVAIAKGVASLYAQNPLARDAAHYIFDSIATTVDLDDEDQINAATAVSGSGPAYVYAFVKALEAAANQTGLRPEDAKRLARATLISAAHLLDVSDAEPDALIKQVMSPGGTTEAAMQVLGSEDGIDGLMHRTVQAALRRAKSLG